jgi:hypothetical protein
MRAVGRRVIGLALRRAGYPEGLDEQLKTDS